MGIQDDPTILKNGNCNNQKKVNCATFNFIYLNVAHLLKNSTQNRSKINLLNDVVDSNCLFLGLTETHLNEKISDNEINIDKFNIVRCDRLIRKGGGVCLYVNQRAQFSMCVSYSNQTCELLIVKIHSPEIYVIIMYRPPDCELSEFEDVLNILISWIRSLSSPLPDIFLMGDFNFPSHDWAHNQLISSSNQVSLLLNASDSLFLEQMVTVPTRKKNILDLVFTSHDLIDTISVQNTAISDHNIIYVELNLPTETNSSAACNRSAKNPPKNCFESLNFNKADFVEMNSKLELVNWPILLNNNSASECFKLFSMVLSSICLECVPKKSSSTIHKNSFYKKRRPMMRRRTKINKMITSMNYSKTEKLSKELVEIELKLLTSYNEERLHYENVAISKIKSDSKYFFRYADKHRKTKKSIGPLNTGKDEFTSDPTEMCNLLQHQYLKVFSNPSLSNRIDDVNSFFMMDNSDIEIPLLDSINSLSAK